MSTKVMGQVWDLDLPHAEAWILMALADHADHEGGNAFPGQDLLAYKTGYSQRQVRRILDALEKKRIIVAEGGGRGRGVTRRYRLMLQNAPKKPDRTSAYSKQKRGQDVRTKEDKMSGNLDQKTGQNVQPKEDKTSTFPDAKSGHFGHEKADISGTKKRTFSTQKADISNSSHDKERARINHHEPSIEPSEREENSAALSAIDELANTLCKLYRIPDSAGWELRDEFQHLAIKLHGIEATVLEVQTFCTSRQKKPVAKFFVGDFVAWRASQSREGGVAESSRPPIVTAPPDYGRKRPNGGIQ